MDDHGRPVDLGSRPFQEHERIVADPETFFRGIEDLIQRNRQLLRVRHRANGFIDIGF
jgi:hypothetical protein